MEDNIDAGVADGTGPVSLGVTEDMLSLYMTALRDGYLRMRRRWRPEMHSVSHKHDEELRVLAYQLIEKRIDPYHYMKFACEYFARFASDVYVRMVCAPKVLESYEAFSVTHERELTLTISLQQGRVQGRLRAGDTLEEILNDTHESLSAVFRYAVAHRMGRPDLAERFKEKANEMLLFEPLYTKLMGSMLPKGNN